MLYPALRQRGDASRAALNGDWSAIMGRLWIVIVYAAVVLVLAAAAFSRQMKKG